MHITVYKINTWLIDRWLISHPKDQDGQLQWLADTLLQAEKDNERVHILGHIPSGDSGCQRTWSREFRKIIVRLVSEHTIVVTS
jgi:sphingomyelin phosphodiesterase